MHINVASVAAEHDDTAGGCRNRRYPQSLRPLGMVFHAGEASEPSGWEDPRRKKAGNTQHAGSVFG